MPGRFSRSHGSASERSNETHTPRLALSPIESILDGGDCTSHSFSKIQSTISFTTGSPETPSRRGSTVDHNSSLLRSAGMTTLLRPASVASSSARPTQPSLLSPNTSPRRVLSSRSPTEWAAESEFVGASEPGGLPGIGETPPPATSQLPVLTTMSLAGPRNSPCSVGERTTPLLSTAGAAPTSAQADASTTAGLGMELMTPGSSCPGRSLTLLERRTNRERSMMSISCLSGLNAETIQASMRDVGVGAAADSQQKSTPPTHGWSKTVASAALLSDYNVPRTTAVATAGAEGSPAPTGPTPSAAAARPLPAATPACRGSGAAAALRRSSLSPPQSAVTALSPALAQCNGKAAAAGKTLDSIPGAIKVASYNILASRLASTDLYPHCPPSVLSEEYRVNLVKEEVRAMDPDILLMEEISVAVHEESLGPYLKSTLGLEGHHAVITDRNGQPRCSTRPPTASSTPASSKGPSSTRKKFDGLSLAALRGTNATTTTTPLTPPSLTGTGRGAGDVVNGAAGEGRGGDPCLPPLVRTGSNGQPPSRGGSDILTCPPPMRRRGSRSPQPPHSLTSMGATHTTMGTVNGSSATSPSHAVVGRPSSSSLSGGPLQLASIAGAVSAAADAARESGAPPSPRKAAAGLSHSSPGTPAELPNPGCSENHRRIEMDGVAIYYKACRFRVLEVVPVYFNALAAAEDRLTPYEHQKLQVNSHNVALITVLHDTYALGPPHIYIVAAVHFIWQRTNAQLWQAHQLLRVVEDLKGRYGKCDGDLVSVALARRSTGADSMLTQPPSLVDSPLHHERGRPGMRREFPSSSSPARRPSVPHRPHTAAPDTTAEGGPSSLDHAAWRRESVVSTSTISGVAQVTCLIGGDFNSDRSGPVIEYLRTGRVPDGVQVMEYWKASTPFSPVHRRDTNAEVAAETSEVTVVVSDGEKDEEAAHEPPPSLPVIVAPTPPKRPTARIPVLETTTMPPSDSLSCSSLGSPPSPTQPSMQPHQQTHSPPQALGVDSAVLSDDENAAFLLQPSTPPRHRQSQPFAGRLSDGTWAAVDSVLTTPTRDSHVHDSAPARISGAVAPASPLGAEEGPYQLACLTKFKFGRGSASLVTSPISGSLAEAAVDRSAAESGSAPTVAVTPSARVMAAVGNTAARTRGRSQDSQCSLSHNSRRQKTFKSSSRANAECPVNGSGASTSLHSRRQTSPEALRSIDSSALVEFAAGIKSVSRSHSMSGLESVLSNPFGTPGCAIKLPPQQPQQQQQQQSNDAPRPEPSDVAQASEEDLQPPPPPQRRSKTSGRPQTLTPTLHSPLTGSPSDAVGLVLPSKAGGHAKHQRVKPLPAFSAAAAMVSLGDGNVFDSLIHPQLSQMDNCEPPPAPKAGAKRRSVNEAAKTVSGLSTNGTCSCSTPPASPQASRRRTDTTGITALAASAEHGRRAGEDDWRLSPASSASASSHGVPWPSVLSQSTLSKPATGLVDDVTHSTRFSDAYAPYCYRHPSRVSAVNPSTNMEGRVLDHILYEDDNVVCGAVLRLGEKQELPNARVPSDHYMIGAVLIPIHELHRS